MTHAQALSTYRRMKVPAYAGQLRTKSWSALWMGSNPPQDDDPIWAKRAKDYWLRQQEVYGLVFSPRYTVMIDVINGELYVTTAARVERVLEGIRS